MSAQDSSMFSDLLQEKREFDPPADFAQNAVVRDEKLYKHAREDFEGYWADEAKELTWFSPWRKTLDWTPPHAKWFVDGKINISYNCLDRHLETPRRNKAAIIWECEYG